MDHRKNLGAEGELAAESFLKEKGIHILMRNFRCRFGEIDIIAKEGMYYLIIEVKTRRNNRRGVPAEAVDKKKQRKICRTLDYFRMYYKLSEETPFRFDVIEVDQSLRCRWIRNAFDYDTL